MLLSARFLFGPCSIGNKGSPDLFAASTIDVKQTPYALILEFFTELLDVVKN